MVAETSQNDGLASALGGIATEYHKLQSPFHRANSETAMNDPPPSPKAAKVSAQSVIHHPERQCFTARLGTAEAVLDYRLLPDQGINFHHTYVPEALRGRGVAEALVRAGLAWATQESLHIQASCWYVQRFLRT